jgi:hypothetical protein
MPSAPARDRRLLWLALGVICLAVILVGGYLVLRSPSSGIDAGPPAATPSGFRVVQTDDYRLAVPSSWESRVITAADRDRLADQLGDAAPAAKELLDEAQASVDGTMVIAADPGTRENVNVVPFHALRGDVSDADSIQQIRTQVEGQSTGSGIVGLTTAPADVHGYPALTLTYGVRVGPITAYQVATVIQTGDHAFQVTVTTRSAERAAELSGRIVPTFDPA